MSAITDKTGFPFRSSEAVLQVLNMRCLLEDACVVLGFCGDEVRAEIHDMLQAAPVGPEKFADMLLVFEGLEMDHKHRDALITLFVGTFRTDFDPRLNERQMTALGL